MRVREYSWIALPLLFLAMFTTMAANTTTQENMGVLLNDALYSLNRYEELVSGVDCRTWKVSEHLRRVCAQEKQTLGEGANNTKIVLMRATKASSPSLVDLLDIYGELEMIAGHLDDLGNDVSNFQGGDGMAFTEAGNKTLVLGEKLYAQLRERLSRMELRCREK